MGSISIDASEVRTFAADARRAAAALPVEVKQVVAKGAVQVKADLSKAMKGSRHFKGFSSISYDLIEGGFGAEIGPDKGGPGAGANLAYFGTSRGGGTVEDPVEALNREAPRMEQSILSLLDRLLR